MLLLSYPDTQTTMYLATGGSLDEKIHKVQERKKSLDAQKLDHLLSNMHRHEEKTKYAQEHKRQSIDEVKEKALIQNLDSEGSLFLFCLKGIPDIADRL